MISLGETATTRLQLTKPDSSEFVDFQDHLNDNWDLVDQYTGLFSCTSGTRPATKFNGMLIVETDTWLVRRWNSSSSRWEHVGGKVPKVFAKLSVDDSVANAAFEVQSWGAENYEDTPSADYMHSTGTNPSRILLPIIGLWEYKVSHHWTANATGVRRMMIRKNAAGNAAGGSVIDYAYNTTLNGFSTVIRLAGEIKTTVVTDYIESFAYQNSGGALVIDSSDDGACYFKARLVHADDVA